MRKAAKVLVVVLLVVIGSFVYLFITHLSRPRYEITDLGTLGGTNSYAKAINDAEQVIGNSENANGSERAFFWDAASGMTDLGTLGGNRSRARGVNNSGQVVGTSKTSF